eukprot:4221396-Prorocentrum_lima.AAC.1
MEGDGDYPSDSFDRLATLISDLRAQTRSNTDKWSNTLSHFRDDITKRLSEHPERIESLEGQ